MSKKGGDLLHLHKLPTGGPKPKRLEKRGGSDKRLVIPKPNGMRHRRVSLGEQILKLVSLEVIGDGEIATVL